MTIILIPDKDFTAYFLDLLFHQNDDSPGIFSPDDSGLTPVLILRLQEVISQPSGSANQGTRWW